MLNLEDFKVKNAKTGQRNSWCRDCSREYQQERYVRLGYKRVTAEVLEGDACVGHSCPKCGDAFLVGERIQGENVHHERCAELPMPETPLADLFASRFAQ